VDALTHVNFAFVFLNPTTYEIAPMDGSTPAQLFADTTAIKIYKPSLQVWLSLGGWTFSDDGTATQPLLGEISRSASKRQQFSNHVLNFLESYGFDGIDIDWYAIPPALLQHILHVFHGVWLRRLPQGVSWGSRPRGPPRRRP
jgi:chitinase